MSITFTFATRGIVTLGRGQKIATVNPAHVQGLARHGPVAYGKFMTDPWKNSVYYIYMILHDKTPLKSTSHGYLPT